MNSTMSDPTDLRIAQSVKEFAEVGRRYCEWAEGSALEPNEDMLAARCLLAELHIAAINLPENSPDTDDAEDRTFPEQWHAVCRRFSNLPVRGYWDVFDPLQDEKPVFNTLWDDLTDTYQDIKEGLLLFDDGKIEEAIWEWRFHFQIHWGAHLTGAQRAIHSYFNQLE